MADNSDLRVAVVGAGWIAEHAHLPGYNRAGASIVGVADLVRERAEAAAKQFDVPAAYTDWRLMLAEQRPDVVSVCVPNMFHAEVANGAMKAGAHVLCEKPLATSVAEAREMFDTARRSGVLLMASQNFRFRPGNELIKARIEAGEFGDIYHAEAVYIRRLGIPTWGSFTQKSLSYGGPLCDLGVHVLDLAVWFMGNPRAVRVAAATESRFGSRPEIAAIRNAWDPAKFDVEDFSTAFVRFEGGATLYMQASWASNIDKGREYVKLLGSEAGATTDPPTLYYLRDGKQVDEPLEAAHVSGWEEGIAHFLDAVRGRTQPRVREEETMNVQRILNAAYESAALGREVEIRG